MRIRDTMAREHDPRLDAQRLFGRARHSGRCRNRPRRTRLVGRLSGYGGCRTFGRRKRRGLHRQRHHLQGRGQRQIPESQTDVFKKNRQCPQRFKLLPSLLLHQQRGHHVVCQKQQGRTLFRKRHSSRPERIHERRQRRGLDAGRRLLHAGCANAQHLAVRWREVCSGTQNARL